MVSTILSALLWVKNRSQESRLQATEANSEWLLRKAVLFKRCIAVNLEEQAQDSFWGWYLKPWCATGSTEKYSDHIAMADSVVSGLSLATLRPETLSLQPAQSAQWSPCKASIFGIRPSWVGEWMLLVDSRSHTVSLAVTKLETSGFLPWVDTAHKTGHCPYVAWIFRICWVTRKLTVIIHTCHLILVTTSCGIT